MSVNILRITARIAAIPIESKIRHRNKSDGKFNLAKFKKLEDPYEVLSYAENTLESAGEGSSRKVFILTNSKVLKIAIELDRPGSKGDESHGAGLDQNKSEVDIYTNPKTKPIIAEVFDFDPEYLWIISETVRPLPNSDAGKDEWSRIMGSDWHATMHAAERASLGYDVTSIIDGADVDTKVLDMISNLYDLGLEDSDFQRVSHWGKTTSGRVVLLDYGFTQDVLTNHYEEPEPDEWEDVETNDGEPSEESELAPKTHPDQLRLFE